MKMKTLPCPRDFEIADLLELNSSKYILSTEMCTVYCRYYNIQYLVTSLLIVLLSITVLNFFRSFRILSLQNVIYSILLQKCWSKGKTYLNVMIIVCKKCTVDSWDLFFYLFCKLFKRFNYFSSPAPQLSAIKMFHQTCDNKVLEYNHSIQSVYR